MKLFGKRAAIAVFVLLAVFGVISGVPYIAKIRTLFERRDSSAAPVQMASNTGGRPAASTSWQQIHGPEEARVREFFANDPVMIAIAACESHYRQFNDDGSVLRNRNGVDAVGIFQIRESVWGAKARELGHDINTVEGNIAMAAYIREKQGVDKPWQETKDCWGQNQEKLRGIDRSFAIALQAGRDTIIPIPICTRYDLVIPAENQALVSANGNPPQAERNTDSIHREGVVKSLRISLEKPGEITMIFTHVNHPLCG